MKTSRRPIIYTAIISTMVSSGATEAVNVVKQMGEMVYQRLASVSPAQIEAAPHARLKE